MFRRLAVFLFTLALWAGGSQQAVAQLFYSATEYGITLGGSQYFGDLNDNYGLKFIRPVGGIFLRQQLTQYIAIRGALSYTKVGYKDSYNDNDFYRMRNLSFQSDVVELVVQSEFNFTRFATGEDGRRFTPYLTGGVGVFYFNPYAELAGSKHYLRKLGTEGQNLEGFERQYSSVAVCFPVGLGFKYWVKPGVNIGFEIADRLTFTDYLDDVSQTYAGSDNFPNSPDFPNPAYYLQDRSPEVSPVALGRPGKQRGNSQTWDQYMYAIFNISFQLKVYRCPSYLQEGVME